MIFAILNQKNPNSIPMISCWMANHHFPIKTAHKIWLFGCLNQHFVGESPHSDGPKII